MLEPTPAVLVCRNSHDVFDGNAKEYVIAFRLGANGMSRFQPGEPIYDHEDDVFGGSLTLKTHAAELQTLPDIACEESERERRGQLSPGRAD